MFVRLQCSHRTGAQLLAPDGIHSPTAAHYHCPSRCRARAQHCGRGGAGRLGSGWQVDGWFGGSQSRFRGVGLAAGAAMFCSWAVMTRPLSGLGFFMLKKPVCSGRPPGTWEGRNEAMCVRELCGGNAASDGRVSCCF